LPNTHLAGEIDYISTGGGAFLEVLEGKKLPALEILERRARDNQVLLHEPPGRSQGEYRSAQREGLQMSDSSVPRATKIVATLGPASSSAEILERMIRAGVDVMRLNFSHGTAQDHIDRATLIREVAAKVGKEVAIMADLQGRRSASARSPTARRRSSPARSSSSTPPGPSSARASASASTTRSCRATCGPATRCSSTTGCCA
jgi:hypothetical protein